MRAVVLAAGRGQRLAPLTDDRPKCMVEFARQPMLVRQLATLRRAGIDDITVVTGYRPDSIGSLGVRTAHNPRWDVTNMVATAMCAREAFDGRDDVILAYADIVYQSRVLQTLIESSAPVSTVVDLGWLDLWRLRMADPLRDAETLRMDSAGNILELGKKPQRIEQIEGQYIGLTRVSREFAQEFVARYDRLDPAGPYDGKNRDNMYMTSYLQYLIDEGPGVRAACVRHGWIEVDTIEDLHVYSQMYADGRLRPLLDLEA